jgi:hypothetical protein
MRSSAGGTAAIRVPRGLGPRSAHRSGNRRKSPLVLEIACFRTLRTTRP